MELDEKPSYEQKSINVAHRLQVKSRDSKDVSLCILILLLLRTLLCLWGACKVTEWRVNTESRYWRVGMADKGVAISWWAEEVVKHANVLWVSRETKGEGDDGDLYEHSGDSRCIKKEYHQIKRPKCENMKEGGREGERAGMCKN